MNDQREIQRARVEQWRQNNITAYRMSSRASSRKWRLANPDKEAEKVHNYRENNKGAYNAYMKEYMGKRYKYNTECERLREIDLWE